MNKNLKIFLIVTAILALITIGVLLFIYFGPQAAASVPVVAAGSEVVRRKLKEKSQNDIKFDEPVEIDVKTNKNLNKNTDFDKKSTLSTQSTPIKPVITSVKPKTDDQIVNELTIPSENDAQFVSFSPDISKAKYMCILKRQKGVEKGPGTLTLYKNSKKVKEWQCITGGKQTDPAKYGGLTPTCEWTMIETIKRRTHPTSKSRFKFARIVPLGDKTEWPNRTFDIDKWPFMIHVAGRSSGCIAILPKDFDDCTETLNNAFREHSFKIKVVEK